MKARQFKIFIVLAFLLASAYADAQDTKNDLDVNTRAEVIDSNRFRTGLVIFNDSNTVNSNQKVERCKRAPNEVDIDIQITCAYLFEIGMFVPKNFQTAARWYQYAASQGSAIAQFRLGILYAVGKGVTQSDTMAEQHWQNSVNLGYKPALQALKLWSDPSMEVCTGAGQIDPGNPTSYLPLKPGQWRIDLIYSPLMVTKQYAGKKQCESSKAVCVKQAPNLARGEFWPDERYLGPEIWAKVNLNSSTEKEIETEGHGSFSEMKMTKYSDDRYEVTEIDHFLAEDESLYLQLPLIETSQTIKASYVGICQ